jgi:LCP family protein required for cell wall assembly
MRREHRAAHKAGVVVPSRGPSRALSRMERVFRVLAITVSALLFAVTTGGYLVYRHLNGNINHLPVPGLKTHHGKTVNYLIIGSDNRQVAGGQQYGAHDFENLSDTVILAHLPGNGKSAQLISFPRDGLVEIPTCAKWKGGPGSKAPHMDKFNTAYSLGGPACTIKTVEDMSGISIDDFIVVSLPGFVKISDALGGVEICLPQAVADKNSKLYLSAGRHKVSGQTALAFVRERDQLGGSRIHRQQEFLGSAVKEATRTGLLLNPGKLYHLLDVTTKAITTGHLSLNDLRNVAERFQHIKPGNVVFYTVPTEPTEPRVHLPGYNNPNGVFVDIIIKSEAEQLFSEIRSNRPVVAPTPSASSAVRLVVSASHVPVRVLNGTGVKGAAAKAATDLRNAGFDVVGTGDADNSGYTQTIVRYGAQRVESSQTLAAAVPGSVRQSDDGLGNTVDLIIGTNYTGAHSVSVSTASPAPSQPAKPVQGISAAEDACSARFNQSGPA